MKTIVDEGFFVVRWLCVHSADLTGCRLVVQSPWLSRSDGENAM